MRALQSEGGRKWERTKSKEWQRGCFSFQWSFWVMVEADKRTAFALGNPVLKVNPHVIPYKTQSYNDKCGNFHNSDSNSFGRLYLRAEMHLSLQWLLCVLYINAAHYMQHAWYVILNFSQKDIAIFISGLSRSLSGFSYLCGNDIMLQCFSFPLLLLSSLFVVNAVLLSFLCLHKIKVGENKL